MSTLGSVQQKLSCVFETIVLEQSSAKRANQSYAVVASENVSKHAIDSKIESATVTEKLDGTCVYVHEFQGKPWLWARLDRKPTKAADKRFKTFQRTHREWRLTASRGGGETEEPIFEWGSLVKDFKEVPSNWIPAQQVPLNEEGEPLADKIGHIPGWVPVDPSSRQHLWHLSTVDLTNGTAIILRPSSDDDTAEIKLEITTAPLHLLLESTLELIGTNINANPYQLGTKQQPLHVLVRHGAITFAKSPPLQFSDLKAWFETCPDGRVEGIVWHCHDGQMFKLHRTHLGLTWPISGRLRLHTYPVIVNVDLTPMDTAATPQFASLSNHNGTLFSSITEINMS
ncbi:hypothetical protein NP493_222g02012 [Ridgeia piscesae]|uniref:RNA ligase 1 n=1 Tax=Ridgeia piscesae TaxID=27915 RepID=A0AAD9UDZ1_RIDPI|nr:hypothetical protein NP493_222g02012 [Ridgeia piscesae]